ncbi:MAG: hypothetical protein WCX22_05140 [Methanoregula sp.]
MSLLNDFNRAGFLPVMKMENPDGQASMAQTLQKLQIEDSFIMI